MSVGGLGVALYFMRKEHQRIDELMQRHRSRVLRKAARAARDEDRDRAELQDDIGRLLLLTAAVQQLLLQKGALSQAAIEETLTKPTEPIEDRGETP